MIVGAVVDGKYRIEKMLGRGGMGAVYLATHLGTDRTVALKVILSKYATDAASAERFRREARAAGRVRHPNVVDVTDFGVAELDGQPVAYLVMEYLDGCSLAEVQSEDPKLPLDWTVDVIDQLCLAIGALHEKGIVHRDLKPSNVWLEPNLRGGVTVKVLDFGLAKLGETEGDGDGHAADLPPAVPDGDGDATVPCVGTEGEPLTRAGAVFGTPGYMSPEQCAGRPASPASDVYSIGVIAYQMLTGRPPFAGRPSQLVAQHLHDQPRPLHARARDVPRAVSDVVMQALEKEPARRPATARLLAGALRAKAESPGATLWRGLVLALERFPLVFRFTSVLLAPFYAVVLLELSLALLAAYGRLHVPGGAASIAFAVAEMALLIVGGTLARGVAVLVVAQTLLAPLKKARVSIALSVLYRFWSAVSTSTLVVLVLVVVPLLLGIACGRAGLAALPHDAVGGMTLLAVAAAGLAVALASWCETMQFTSAILAEGLGWREALRRSRQLGRRTATETLLLAATSLVIVGVPSVVGPWLESLRVTVPGLVLSVAGLALYRHVTVAILAIMVAVLYFKQRVMEGEPIEPILDQQFLAEPPPRSRWQKRLEVSLASRQAGGARS